MLGEWICAILLITRKIWNGSHSFLLFLLFLPLFLVLELVVELGQHVVHSLHEPNSSRRPLQLLGFSNPAMAVSKGFLE